MFRREYLSSVVNVLTNSVKISDQSKADFETLNLPQTYEEIGEEWCRGHSAVFGTR